MLLDFRVHTFLAVCQRMNFTRAAEDLCVSQPTVTQHIQYLEAQAGAKLFDYRARKLSLTQAGQELLRAARTVAGDEVLLAHKIKDLDGGRSTLAFGSSMTVAEYVVAPRLEGLMRRHPEWNICFTVENTQVLLGMLDRGELEFALVEGFFSREEYDFAVFAHIPFLAVCAADSPLATGSRPVEALLDQRLLVRESGSGTRSILERYLAEQNLSLDSFQNRVEINSLSVLKRLAAAGSGITFLYRIAVEAELRNGMLKQIALDGLAMEHTFSFVWRKGSSYKADYLALFREFGVPGESSAVRPSV